MKVVKRVKEEMDFLKEQRKVYDTAITNEQWKEIEPLYAGMRKRIWLKWELTNSMLYIKNCLSMGKPVA